MTAKIHILEGDDPDRQFDLPGRDGTVAPGGVEPGPGDEQPAVVRPHARIREAIKRGFDYWVVPGRISNSTTRTLNDPRFDADRSRHK